MSVCEARACPGCSAADSQTIGEVGGFRMERCRRCRTLFSARVPGPAEAAAYYDDYYGADNLEVPSFVHRRLDQLVRSLEPHRRLGRWLDVGSGAGALIGAARGNGWEVVGTEVAAAAAEATRARGFDVRIGDLSELRLAPATFDVVSMVEVVEHVAQPAALLAAAHTVLRPGGVLYITTPHGRGVSGRALGMKWSVVAPPEHLQLFSLKGLRAALRAAGFSAHSARTHAVNPSELLGALRSGQSRAGGNCRVDASYRLNESLSSSRSGTLVKQIVNAALSATRLGDSIKLLAERQG
jgi:SAM-dependent methyltransferase